MRSTLAQLLQKGTITLPVNLFTAYKRLGLKETDVLILTQLIILQEVEKVTPALQSVAARMQLTVQQVAEVITGLINAGWLQVLEGKKGYNFSPLYERLAEALEEEQIVVEDPSYQTVFHLIEQQFGRALSPNECEHITKWLDEDFYSEELIEAALREAVYCDKLSIRYMDRMLMEWERKGIRTAEQAIEFSQRFHQQDAPAKPKPSTEAFPFYNWLEG